MAATHDIGDRADTRPLTALIIDLNNFARFPTLAVGYLAASLRSDGISVHVLSPLAHGMPAVQRERREGLSDRVKRRVYLNTHPAFQPLQPLVRDRYTAWSNRPDRTVADHAQQALQATKPDVLLLSAYLDQHRSVTAIGSLAAESGIPFLLGGPAFSQPSTVEEWLDTPGLTAIVSTESDHTLPMLVRAAVNGCDLTAYPGVTTAGGDRGPRAEPLASLDDLPVPDFSDFPWDRYPHRILPVMTGRGCEWSRCLFCSDITSVNGRTFRSRPVDRVVEELAHNGARHQTKDVIFLDIKLNSDLHMWRSIIDRYQQVLPEGRWIGTVHVGRGENGLSDEELEAAARSGLTRVSFGLETGSQRLNDKMAKGTDVADMSAFIRSAHAAGISVRATMISGYPGEEPKDIDATVDFLDRYGDALDRIRLSKFKAIPGTKFQELYDENPARFPDVKHLRWNPRLGRASYTSSAASRSEYRHAKARLLRAVDGINRRPLRDGAEQFDGLM